MKLPNFQPYKNSISTKFCQVRTDALFPKLSTKAKCKLKQTISFRPQESKNTKKITCNHRYGDL